MFRRRSREDFAREIDAHVDIETDRLIADGLDPDEARRAALRAFGNVTRARERYYEAGRWVWLEQTVQDIRYGWRALLQSPSFGATAVLTLAIGIGLVTAAFSVVNAYVLRPYAVQDPGSLHTVRWMSRTDGGGLFRWRDFETLREQRDAFTDTIADSTRFVSSRGRPLVAALVSDNYFDALRPAVALGRALGAADAGAETVVLSHQAWRRLYDGDPGAVGRNLDLNGRAFTIVGVVGPDFVGIGDSPRDFWMSFTTFASIFNPSLIGPDQPASVEVIGRLRPGVTPQQAGAALTPVVAAAVGSRDGVRAEVEPQAAPFAPSLELLVLLTPIFTMFGLVLTTACANVSNLMLARAIARRREIAVRLSLGANRWRVVRQLMTEGMVIACIAGVAGLALARWAVHAGSTLLLGTMPPSVGGLVRLAPMPFDYRVFLFAMAAAGLATVMFALLPALQASHLQLTEAFRGHTGTQRGSRLRRILVAGQVAVSLVLVVVALTLGRAASSLGALDPGYDTSGVLSINTRSEQNLPLAQLASLLHADPRVAGVAVTGGNPLFVRTRNVAAAPAERRDPSPTRYTFGSPAYFPVLRIPVSRGRPFTPDEARDAAPVAIVSAATALAFWPGGDPIGKTIRFEKRDDAPAAEPDGYSRVTVVGVVPDVVSGLLMDGRDRGHIYLPADAASATAAALLVRERTAGALGPQALQEIFSRTGPDPDVYEALPLQEMLALQMYPVRAASWIGSLLGAIALVLAVSGLYGVLSYNLSQRTREIGIRMALGAPSASVVRLVMLQSARLAGVGAAAGGFVAFAGLYVLNAAVRLRTASLLDPAAFMSGAALVLASAALAASLPARRAARVDPAQTLRAEG